VTGFFTPDVYDTPARGVKLDDRPGAEPAREARRGCTVSTAEVLG
jgi:hypothetical protein